MLKILIPEKDFLEKEYIVKVIFDEFLSLSNSIEKGKDKYEIILENGNLVEVNDSFNLSADQKSYLSLDNLPKEITYLESPFSTAAIPILYGKNQIKVSDNKIELNADIFASAFFMLSRWEEYVIKEREEHNRFPAAASIAYKFDFLHRPIVNEYIELLWKMLTHIGFDKTRKKWEYQMVLTHDVDLPKLWWNTRSVVKSLVGSLLKRKNLKEFVFISKLFVRSKMSKKDPFDTFDFIMDLSKKNNIQSHFFFMSGGTSKKDNFYKIDHPAIISLMKKIEARGHIIGFHPSFNAYNEGQQFKKELKHLSEFSSQKINKGREHFLRFEVPTTWQIWEDNDMAWDSTMSYHDVAGFRCGVCYPFPVFNILTRKQLKLVEKPLIVMDGSYVKYQNLDPNEMYRKINTLIEKVKIYNGEFVFLWHNSAFSTYKWKNFEFVYEKIVNENGRK